MYKVKATVVGYKNTPAIFAIKSAMRSPMMVRKLPAGFALQYYRTLVRLLSF
jgi:hypothetical protein